MLLSTISKTKIFLLPIVMAMTGCMATSDTKLRQQPTSPIQWDYQTNIDSEKMLNSTVPEQMVSLFFIRQLDADPRQSGANISINSQYLTSLQPGGISQVYTCAGETTISAVTTNKKSNDLSKDAISRVFSPNQTYYFYLEVDNNERISMTQVTEESAATLLTSSLYQAHQISRVVPNCSNYVEVAPVEVPVLEEKVRIEMKVFFDTDKAVIKPRYFKEVSQVAEFMKKYANTNAVIEGHTDSTASEAYNEALSKRRANSVKQMLVEQYGIEDTRLETIGYGELRPIAPNSTKEGRQLNRRVIATVEQQ